MRSRTFLLAVIGLAAGSAAFARQEFRKPLVPGIELRQIILEATDIGGPNLIHVLTVNPKAKGVRVEAALGGGTVEEAGGGREAVQKMVARADAVAGINAAFFSFDAGDPLGLHIHNGELVSEPWPGRPAMGFRADGTAVIGTPSFSGELKPANGAAHAVAGVNRRCGANELVAYAPIYGSRADDTPVTVALMRAAGQKIRSGSTIRGTVVSLTEEVKTIAPPTDHIVIAGRATGADWLKANLAAGQEVTLRVDLPESGKDWSSVQEAASGMPRLMAGGSAVSDSSAGESFSRTRHPRTAGGVTKDGRFLFVVVDGRQALSRGMSLPELSDLMKSLGATDAMNFDGGGSSTLSVSGIVVNNPSGGVTRPVSDGLVVFADLASGGPVPAEAVNVIGSLEIVSDVKPMSLPGAALLKDAKAVVWGTENGGVWVTQDGKVYGYRTGRHAIRAVAPDGAVRFRQGVVVSAGAPSRIEPTWSAGILTLAVLDINGNGVPGQKATLERGDGATIEVTTGADGKAITPDGWLAGPGAAATIRCGVLSARWAAPAAAAKAPTAAPTPAGAAASNR